MVYVSLRAARPASRPPWRVMLPLLLPPMLLLPGLAACDANGGHRSAPAVADSAGIRVVSLPEIRPLVLAWRLAVDLDVGRMEGPGAFGRIADVAPRAAGGFWVLDGQSRRVHAFDDDGREVLAFGGGGVGPGELRSAGRLSELTSGAVVVGGRMPIELYRFDSRGRPLGTVRPEPASYRDTRRGSAEGRPPPGPAMGEWRFARDGSAFLQAVTLDAPVDDMIRTDVLLRVATDRDEAVRFARWETEAMRGGPGGRMRMFDPTPSWSPLDDGGLWLARGEAYELRRHDDTGGLVEIVRRIAPRVPLTKDLAKTLRSSLAETTDEPGALAMLERAAFPDSLPAVAGLWASESDGTIWVGVIDPSLPLRLEAPNAWDVLAVDGGYLGRLPIPAGFRTTRIDDGYVYGVWLDELDIPHARRYRVEKAE